MLEFTLPTGKKTIVSFKEENIIIDEKTRDWNWIRISDHQFHVIYGYDSLTVDIVSVNKEEKSVRLKVNGKEITLKGKNQMDLLLEKLGFDKVKNLKINELKAPMPGLILDIPVSVGSEVKKGDKLLVLEAMKMENVIKAPANVKIASVKVKVGDNVEKNQLLISFE